MPIAETLSCAAVTSLVWAYSNRRAHERKRAVKRLQGLKMCHQLLKLVGVVQQHRGMVGASLNGNSEFNHKIRQRQDEADALFNHVAEGLQQRWSLFRPYGWSNVIQRWQSIKTEWSQWDAWDSFEAHTQLISLQLDLMAEICERSGLGMLRSNADNQLVAYALKLIPLMLESAGQTRALGVGVSVRQHCDVPTRLRLLFLRQRLQQGQDKVKQQFGDLASDEKTRLNSVWHQVQGAKKTEELFSIVSEQFLGHVGVKVEPNAFFNCATSVIEANIAVADEAMRILHGRLQSQSHVKMAIQ